MSDLNKEVRRFQKPSAQDGVDHLKKYIEQNMNAVSGDIRVMTKQDVESKMGADVQTSKLMQYWHRIQRETKYCSFNIRTPNSTEHSWLISDRSAEHLRKTFRGNDLADLLRHTITFIEDNRIPCDNGGSFNYMMKCQQSGHDVEDALPDTIT